MKAFVAVILLSATSMMAADLTGKWSGSFQVNGGDHAVPQFLILQQQGKRLSGSGGPNAGEQYPIENAIINGDRIRFELTTGEWKFAYDLKAAGEDALDGELKLESVNESRTAKVSLTRLKQK